MPSLLLPLPLILLLLRLHLLSLNDSALSDRATDDSNHQVHPQSHLLSESWIDSGHCDIGDGPSTVTGSSQVPTRPDMLPFTGRAIVAHPTYINIAKHGNQAVDDRRRRRLADAGRMHTASSSARDRSLPPDHLLPLLRSDGLMTLAITAMPSVRPVA